MHTSRCVSCRLAPVMVKVVEGIPHLLKVERMPVLEGVLGEVTQVVRMQPLYSPAPMELPTHMEVCHGV